MKNNSEFDDLSTNEKMLIYMIRQYDLPIEHIFTSIYNAYDIESKDGKVSNGTV